MCYVRWAAVRHTGMPVVFRASVFLLTAALVFASCERLRNVETSPPEFADGEPAAEKAAETDLGEAIAALTQKEQTETAVLARVLNNAALPPEIAVKLEAAIAESPAFILDLLTCLEGDPFLRRLVDKNHPLPDAYEPDDLVELVSGSYELGRRGLLLRRSAAEALEQMSAAARADGVVLVISSAYRSYAYQAEVYARNVKESGQAVADRESARPGYSQHQTGLVVDFGSIDDSFAQTRAGRWILEHGSRFGWSLSFPSGYEAITGYRWESWHYRYVGEDLAAFIDTWFGGIQQYALQFIHAWEAGLE